MDDDESSKKAEDVRFSSAAAEKTDGTKKTLDWLHNHIWLLAAFLGLCIFFAFCIPFVSTKVVTGVYNEADAYWEFAKGERTDLGFGILFGQGSALVWPLLIAFVGALVGVILAVIGKKYPRSLTAAMIVFVISGIFFLIGASFYDYANCLSIVGGASFWDYIKDYRSLASTRLGGGLVFAAVLSFLAALVSYSAALSEEKMSVWDMTEIAVLSASAIVIDIFVHYVIPHVPGQVGSISIATLPLMIIALRHGPTKGFLASGIIFGLITCLSDGYGFFLYPLDYLVGFGSCAVLGFFQPLIFSKEAKTYNLKGEIFIFVGVVLSILVRLIGSAASSMINYGYTLEAALLCNAIYIPVSGAIAAAVLMGAYGPLLNLNRFFQARALKQE
jgi:thiamine transporter